MSYFEYNSISDIASKYDAFIIDLWGVIHDGIEIYDGVINCLENLRNHNKKIIFLSNAPRRVSKAKLVLDRLEIHAKLYDYLLTSGEVTFEYIKSGGHNLGSNYIILGPDRDDDLLDGLDNYKMVKNPIEANFVVVTGFDYDNSTIEDVSFELNEYRKYNLPLICANPDLIVVRKNGSMALCAGVIANYYNNLGGKVISFGKPNPNVYEKSIKLLNIKSTARIAAIGDNLQTDIQGANNMGIDSYLIAGGILGKDLGIEHGQLPKQGDLLNICNQTKIMPHAVLPAFIW